MDRLTFGDGGIIGATDRLGKLDAAGRPGTRRRPASSTRRIARLGFGKLHGHEVLLARYPDLKAAGSGSKALVVLNGLVAPASGKALSTGK